MKTIRLGRRSLAVAGLLLGGAAIVSLVALGGGDEDAQAERTAVPTEPLERRDLAEEVTVEGALGYADEAGVIDRLSGTITWLPAEGSVIRRGGRLFEIDDGPVVLFYGDTPAYRALAEGSAGPDVKALEANLAELGFDGGGAMTVDSQYTAATATAVSNWQESRGLKQTGAVELGRVVFQPGPRRVASLDVALGSEASAGSGGGAATTADGATTVFAALQTPDEKEPEKEPGRGDEKPDEDQGQEDQPDTAEAAPEAVEPEAPAASGEASSDEPAAVSVQAMTTTSTRRVVTLELDPDQVSAAERGSRATVTLPNGDEVKGSIATIATVAESTSGEDQGEGTESGTDSATIEVTVALSGRAGASGLDQAPVDVELTESVRRNVFAVPVEALIGTAGGDYAIVVADGAERRRIAVEPGLFADGYVEIEGEDLSSGLAVEVPEG